MSVKVYSTPTCPWCTKAKDFLKEKNVEFENFDVSTDEKARNEMLEGTGQMGVPVLNVNGTWIIGFDQEGIEKALKKE